jgi:hypothetical protein
MRSIGCPSAIGGLWVFFRYELSWDDDPPVMYCSLLGSVVLINGD